MACVVCGRKIENAARTGRPAVYCRPDSGRRKSHCQELSELLRRVTVLIDWLRAERRSGQFGVEVKSAWKTFHWLSNVLRPQNQKRGEHGRFA